MKPDEILAEMVVGLLVKGMKRRLIFEKIERIVSGNSGLDFDRKLVGTNIDQYIQQGVKIVTYWDKNYPPLLREIDDPPVCLFYKGVWLNSGQKWLSVVGSRKMSERGEKAVRRLIPKFVRAGIGIVSGLALGIDGCVHRVCLENGGGIIAVLPCGLDRIYPKQHEYLAEKIVKRGGCLISEYPFETKIEKYRFLERNRIMVGISGGVLVVEAERFSGSVSTANWAAEQGREVWCVKAEKGEMNSAGVLELIADGAKEIGV